MSPLPARVATTPRAKGVFPEDHELSLGVFGFAGHEAARETLLGEQVDVLFTVVRRLTESGVAVVSISHRLDELFRIADEVTVMRDGQTIGTYPIGDLDVRKIAELMEVVSRAER